MASSSHRRPPATPIWLPSGWAIQYTGSAVDELRAVEADGGELVLFVPVVLGVLPFLLVAALRQQVHPAHKVARIEVLRIDPGQQRHVRVFRPETRRDPFRALLLHMVEQPADEIADEVGAQRP